MASPSKILRQYIIDLGICGDQNATDWASYSGSIPDTDDVPDNAVGFQRTGSQQEERDVQDGDRNEKPTVQIMVRASTDDEAQDKAAEITSALDKIGVDLTDGGAGVVPVSVDGNSYAIQMATVYIPATFLGQEEKDRQRLYAINVRLIIVSDTPDTYRDIYPYALPSLGDEVLGYHNGVTSRFTISDLLDLAEIDIRPSKIVYTSDIDGLVADASLDGLDGTDMTELIQNTLVPDPEAEIGDIWLINNSGRILIDDVRLKSVTKVSSVFHSEEYAFVKKKSPNSGLNIFTNWNWTPLGEPVDHDITVDAYIDGNRRNFGSGWVEGTVPSNPDTLLYTRLVNTNAEIVCAVLYSGVRNGYVYGVLHDTPSFGVLLANCRRIRGSIFKSQPDGDVVPGNDAVHLDGWNDDVVFEKCGGRCNDDYFAVNPGEGNDQAGAGTGPINLMPGCALAGPNTRITMRDCKGIVATSLCRFLSLKDEHYVDDALIDNCEATVLGSGIFVDTFGGTGDGTNGYVTGVKVRNTKIIGDPANGGYGAIELRTCNVGTIDVEGLTVEGPILGLRAINPCKAERLRIVNSTYNGTYLDVATGTPLVGFVQATQGIRNLEVDFRYSPASFNRGRAFSVAGTVHRVLMSGLYENVSSVVSGEGAAFGTIEATRLHHVNGKGGATIKSDTQIPTLIRGTVLTDVLVDAATVDEFIGEDMARRLSGDFRDSFGGMATDPLGGHMSDSGVNWPNTGSFQVGSGVIRQTGTGKLYLAGSGAADTANKIGTAGQPDTGDFVFEFDSRILTGFIPGQSVVLGLFGDFPTLSDFLGVWVADAGQIRLKHNFDAPAAAFNSVPGGSDWRIRLTVTSVGTSRSVKAELTTDGGLTWSLMWPATPVVCASAPCLFTYFVSGGNGGSSPTTGIQVGGFALYSGTPVIPPVRLGFGTRDGTRFLRDDGTWSPLVVPAAANPTGAVGTAAVNGSASTFMRSDAAPALNLAITPTWTGQHVFNSASPTVIRQSGGVAGTDELQISHDGTNVLIDNKNDAVGGGNIQFRDASGNPIKIVVGAVRFNNANGHSLSGAGVGLGSAGQFTWNSNSDGSGSDTGLARSAAKVVKLTDGGAGGGGVEFKEMTAPAAGAADTARFYAEDNGSGKTRLVAKFSDGSTVVVATQP